jgi:hypothetical protein
VYCFISAQHDLDAIACYLDRYAAQPHAQRAYRKELERFLLWSILVKAKPMSSLNTTDCEHYKAFLAQPSPAFSAKKRRAIPGSGGLLAMQANSARSANVMP